MLCSSTHSFGESVTNLGLEELLSQLVSQLLTYVLADIAAKIYKSISRNCKNDNRKIYEIAYVTSN